MKILWIFFFFFFFGGGGSSQNWASLRVISMQLSVFLRSRYRIGIFFGVAKISNIFWGCLKFPPPPPPPGTIVLGKYSPTCDVAV